MQTESAEEAESLGFCFLVPNSTFYLPDRELTEEEMLQIIDFYAKRDYALAGQYGVTEEGLEIDRYFSIDAPVGDEASNIFQA